MFAPANDSPASLYPAGGSTGIQEAIMINKEFNQQYTSTYDFTGATWTQAGTIERPKGLDTLRWGILSAGTFNNAIVNLKLQGTNEPADDNNNSPTTIDLGWSDIANTGITGPVLINVTNLGLQGIDVTSWRWLRIFAEIDTGAGSPTTNLVFTSTINSQYLG